MLKQNISPNNMMVDHFIFYLQLLYGNFVFFFPLEVLKTPSNKSPIQDSVYVYMKIEEVGYEYIMKKCKS